MKYFLFLLLVLPFIGCGSSHLQGNRVRIEFSDSSSKEYELLSVRPDVFVVSEDLVDTTLKAKLVPISHVRRVYTGSNAKIRGMLIGGLAGGMISYVAIGGGGLIVASEGAGIILVASMIAGGIIGYLIPSFEIAYDPMDAEDLIYIKELARYDRYSEPPELQKLK